MPSCFRLVPLPFLTPDPHMSFTSFFYCRLLGAHIMGPSAGEMIHEVRVTKLLPDTVLPDIQYHRCMKQQFF